MKTIERKYIMTENSLHQSQEFGINEYEDYIEMRLCKKRKKIYRKKGKLMERWYSWKDSGDVNLPF